jgi:hypothetical protein
MPFVFWARSCFDGGLKLNNAITGTAPLLGNQRQWLNVFAFVAYL